MTSATSTYGGLPRALVITRSAFESRAVCAHLEELKELEDARGTVYWQGIFKRDDALWMVGVTEITAEGPMGAREVERAVVFFKSQFSLFVGVMEGREGVSLGDVVVATRVYGYASDASGREQTFRPIEFRPTYSLLDRVREEVEGLAWLSHLQGGMPADAPRVVLGQVATGERMLSSTHQPSFPLLPRQQGGVVAAAGEDVVFYRSAFQDNAKALLVQGIGSLRGQSVGEVAEEQLEKAASHASAFAFHLLSQVTPIQPQELRAAAVGLGPRSTWTAMSLALLFGIIVSIPVLCIRQNAYVRDISVGQWTVWLGANYHKYKDQRYWLVSKGKSKVPVALLYLDPSTFEGFGQATPLYWNPSLGGYNSSKWSLQPWKRVEPPESLRHHLWLMLLRRADGSLTFPHLFPNMPKRGRALVFSSYKRKVPVGEISFVLGSQLSIQRKFWDWKTLSEEQGPWGLRLVKNNHRTPARLKKHVWPPLLTLQQDRFQDSSRWRFLDKVAGLQWPGSQWIVLRPGTEQAAQEPFGLVELEPGEGRWVKVLRLAWKGIQDYRHITVKYFDPNKTKMPDLSRFGELRGPCSRKSSPAGFGVCLRTNLGRMYGAHPWDWYAVYRRSKPGRGRKKAKVTGFVQLLEVDENTSRGQGLLCNVSRKRSKRLVRLSSKERQNHAVRLCRKALSGLRQLLRLPAQRLRDPAVQKRRAVLKEMRLASSLLGGQVSRKEWSLPSRHSVLGECLALNETLARSVSSKSRAMGWSERWRAALALRKKPPKEAYVTFQRLCRTTNFPESQYLCYKALLRLELALGKPITRAWEKRLRWMLHYKPCFTVLGGSGQASKAWKRLEAELRTVDNKPYRKSLCRERRYKVQPIKILLLQTQPIIQGHNTGTLYALGERMTRAMQSEIVEYWNERGLQGKPKVIVRKDYRVPQNKSREALRSWFREVAKHSGASVVLAGAIGLQDEEYSVRFYAFPHITLRGFGSKSRVPQLWMWKRAQTLKLWRKPKVFLQPVMARIWKLLLRLQRQPIQRSAALSDAVRREPAPTKAPITSKNSKGSQRKQEHGETRMKSRVLPGSLPSSRPAGPK